MATTIQVSNELKGELETMKMFDNETYEDIIWDLIEDRKILSEETLKEIEEAREEVRKGKVHKFTDLKKKLRI